MHAFYTTPLLRAERWVLARMLGKPNTDAQAAAVADGRADTFAVWRVAARPAEEILLTDESGRTSSWLKVDYPGATSAGGGTRLLFGAAMAPRSDAALPARAASCSQSGRHRGRPHRGANPADVTQGETR